MSTVYNPEADRVAAIERLELEARDLRRRLEHVVNERDKGVLNRQLQEIREEIKALSARLP
jgi:hypothetical protein